LTPTIETNISSFAFAGHGFQLETFQQGLGEIEVNFNAPVTITIDYSNKDLRLVNNESELWIGFWENGGWVDATETCNPPSSYTRDLGNNTLSVPVCHFSRYGLFGPSSTLYLPVVMR